MGLRWYRHGLNKPVVAAAGGDWWLSGGISAANCIAAYQAKGAASYAASKVNLANPGTYNATEGTAPDWDAVNGWDGDGSSQYLNTGVVVGSFSWSAIVRYSGAVNSNDGIFMAGDYGEGDYRGFGLACLHVAPKQRWYNGGYIDNYAQDVTASGVAALCNGKAYLDGVYLGDVASQGNVPEDAMQFLHGGNMAQYFPGQIQAGAVYNIDISSYVSALTTAMNTL